MAESQRKTTAAVQALVIACQLDAQAKEPKCLKKVLAQLGEDHAADRGIYYVLGVVYETGHLPAGQAPASDFFRKVIANNKDRKTQGMGSYLLAMLLADGPGKQDEEAIRLLERCTKDYKDVAVDREQKLGDLAQPLLYRLRFLSVGKTAPEIMAEDMDGKKFKLSEYRGKVVLLDFFADWCPHCSAMYPHERQVGAELREPAVRAPGGELRQEQRDVAAADGAKQSDLALLVRRRQPHPPAMASGRLPAALFAG
jgi:thiol-disulfide isomerase/thioredoxin